MHSERASARGRGKRFGRFAAALTTILAAAHIALAAHAECGTESVRRQVGAALAAIERAADPCGDTEEIRQILSALRRCDAATYRICIDRRSPRNIVDPRIPEIGSPTYLTWNPELRTELQSVCEDDPAKAVWRDPTASLLHEIVHVVQDCNGLDPASHEAEAVRVENIFRRARGLCQRTRYGRDALPSSVFRSCATATCSCERDGREAAKPRGQPGIAARQANPAGDTVARQPPAPGFTPP